MRASRRLLPALAMISAGAVGAGCQGPPPAIEQTGPQFAIQRSLVIMPAIDSTTPAGEFAPEAWEFARNDDAQGIGGQSGLYERREIIGYSRDRLRTDSGRPRENSRTVTREFRRGILYVK